MSQIKTAILKALNSSNGGEYEGEMVTDLLDLFSNGEMDAEVGTALRQMRREGTVRLVAIGDRSQLSGETLARCEAAIESENETFVRVELAA